MLYKREFYDRIQTGSWLAVKNETITGRRWTVPVIFFCCIHPVAPYAVFHNAFPPLLPFCKVFMSKHHRYGSFLSTALLAKDCQMRNNEAQLLAVVDRRKLLYSSLLVATTDMVLPFVSSVPCAALSPKEASMAYDKYSTSYDAFGGGTLVSKLGIDQARTKLIQLARGNVLEIAAGTGLNLEKYQFSTSTTSDHGGVTALTLIDISSGMLSEAKLKFHSLNNIPRHVTVQFIEADATSELVSLFGSNFFDTVVDTFSFCVMGNDGATDCLKQIRNVVKSAGDGGKILLLENTRASNPLLGWYQDATADVAATAGGKGCLYNQDVTTLIQQTNGLELIEEDAFAAGLFRSFVCIKP